MLVMPCHCSLLEFERGDCNFVLFGDEHLSFKDHGAMTFCCCFHFVHEVFVFALSLVEHFGVHGKL